jgi:hypothetical protein
MMRNLIDMLWGEWKTVEQQIEELTDKLEQISASDAGANVNRTPRAQDDRSHNSP